MKIKSFFIFPALLSILLLSSCRSYENVPYFVNIPTDTVVYTDGVVLGNTVYNALQVKPDDVLQISIQVMDNNLSAVQNEQRNPNNASAEERGAIGYLVDKNGNIELPLIGTIQVAGLTTTQIKEQIAQRAKRYYVDPVINVRLGNFKISVLGEVNQPGSYFVAGERISVLDALGLAGDMTIYGKRENIMLIRQEGNRQKIVRYNINDGQLLHSPYFYLQQNDVIYVEPAKSKASQTDTFNARNISIITSAVSLLSAIAILLSRL